VDGKKGLKIERIPMSAHKVTIYRPQRDGKPPIAREGYQPFVIDFFKKHMEYHRKGWEYAEDRSGEAEYLAQKEKEFWEQEPDGDPKTLEWIQKRNDEFLEGVIEVAQAVKSGLETEV
jgi:hypothetical protein